MPHYPAAERAAEHLRNALALVHLTMETTECTVGNEGPGFVVSAETLGAIAGRIEAALDHLEPPKPPLRFPERPEGS